jgi:hypothetical protein
MFDVVRGFYHFLARGNFSSNLVFKTFSWKNFNAKYTDLIVDLLLVEYDNKKSLGVLPEERKSFTIDI